MTETADRFATVSAGFTQRVTVVPATAWSNPSPCVGWDARDVVRHLVDWVPAFYRSNADLVLASGPSVDDDPRAAWATLCNAITDVLADPAVAAREFDSRAGRMSVEQSIAMIVTGDVLIHTWDLARATGLDDRLDATEVQRMFDGVQPFDEVLRSSGHYGARVDVPESADVQTKLIAFMGRQP